MRLIEILLTILLILSNGVGAQQQETQRAESLNIPESVRRPFTIKQLENQYEISFHLNPFYLRGDFNGDGKADIATLVKQRKTNKVGIAIMHAGIAQIFFVGAGNNCGNGGDNFDWMDYWYVYTKGRVHRGVGERTVPRLTGEALYVGKSEAASALIYWNGRRYLWYQQGD